MSPNSKLILATYLDRLTKNIVWNYLYGLDEIRCGRQVVSVDDALTELERICEIAGNASLFLMAMKGEKV